jgi:phage gpG-like protein
MADDASELTAELHALASAAGDLTPAFQRAAEVFRSAVEEHFAGGGAGWESWSDGYADLPFAHRGPGRSLLVREGELLASLADSSHRQHVARIQSDQLTIGSRRPTAQLHQQGRRGGRSGRMPARDPMPTTRLLEQRWTPVVEGHVTGRSQQRLGL